MAFSSQRSVDNAQPQAQLPLLREGRLCIEQAGCQTAVLVAGNLPANARELIDARIAQAQGAPLAVCFVSSGGDAASVTGVSFPANVTTCVPRVLYANGAVEEGKCESTCVWLWLAGQHRELFRYAHLGLHEPYLLASCACKASNWLRARGIKAKLELQDRVRLASDPVQFALRRKVFAMGEGYGPNESRIVWPKEAIELGMQQGPVRKGVFIVTGAPESLL